MSWVQELRAELVEKRDALERRLSRISADRRGVSAPPEADEEEQALRGENDEVLDALDSAGREELAEIVEAIARIDAGTYESCARCGKPIGEKRLRALPTASLCLACSG